MVLQLEVTLESACHVDPSASTGEQQSMNRCCVLNQTLSRKVSNPKELHLIFTTAARDSPMAFYEILSGF